MPEEVGALDKVGASGGLAEVGGSAVGDAGAVVVGGLGLLLGEGDRELSGEG
jgi:hypothetical protein